jgi:hypothetical protein
VSGLVGVVLQADQIEAELVGQPAEPQGVGQRVGVRGREEAES